MANTAEDVELARSLTKRLIAAGHMHDSAFTQASRIILRALDDQRSVNRMINDSITKYRDAAVFGDAAPIVASFPWDNKEWLDAFGLMAEIERDRCWAEAERDMCRPGRVTWVKYPPMMPERLRDRYRQFGL